MHVGVGKHLRQVIDRPAGHAGGFQQRDPFGGGFKHCGLAQQRNQFAAMGHTRLVAGKARIIGQRQQTSDLAQFAELPVVAHGDDEVAIGRGKILIRHDIRVSVTQAFGRDAGVEVIHRLIGQASHLHIQQGHVDMLTKAGLFALIERGQHADRGVQAGENIG